ncbi:Vacuolar iron transporter [Lachnellula suecica]|uniref:Vacuolar iron transporter n=1 Tax=Lachnellula suecica TaxID=602035 RepID=A0A8T9C4Z0_9HELO|nr:Vacuolar iron transporter [Lachnellula suecica]
MSSTNIPQNPFEMHEIELTPMQSLAASSLRDGESSGQPTESPPSSISAPERSNEVVKQQKARQLRSDVVRDFIIGFADGMTVPFALTAGLSVVATRKTLIAAGLLELIGGAISMGGSAFLAAIQERDEFLAEEQREAERIRTEPEEACEDVAELMRGYQVDRPTVEPVLRMLSQNPESFLRFLMDFKHHMSKTTFAWACLAAAVMGLAYIFAGIIPMIPYFAMANITHALYVSIALAVVEISIFGFNNGYQTFGTKSAGFRVAAKTVLVGLVAAGCTYGTGRILNVIIS